MGFVSFNEAVTTGGNLRNGYLKSVNKQGQVYYYKKKSNEEKTQPKKKDKPIFKVEDIVTIINFD